MCLMSYRIFLFVALFLSVIHQLKAQDVEQKYNSLRDRLANDPIKVTGSFSALGQHYQAFGIDNRSLPFNGRLLAALNFDLLGIKVPLSVAMSNGGVVFNRRLPSYSFIGISPSYRWAKLLIGTRSMDFGKYSFSNHSFTGGGLELTPGNFYLSGFYGRLRRARVEDFQGVNNVDPFYRRMGFGGKVGYKSGNDIAMLSLFKAWDIEKSIPREVIASNLDFYPSENVIISGEISKKIGSKMDLEITYSNSGFTTDRNIDKTSRPFRLSTYGGLLAKNASSRINDAFETKLSYRFKFFSVNVAYERIDPGYRTMGALFFNNDLENVSGGGKVKLFKSRLMINGRIGVQRNNLNDNQANQYKRLVGNLNANLRATNQLNFMFSFSNFNNVNRRISIAAIDTLVLVTDLVLSNQNATAGFNWILNNDNTRVSGLQSSVTYSQGSTIENDVIMENQSVGTINANLNYYLQLKPSRWNIGGNIAYQQNELGTLQTNFRTIGFTVGKGLLRQKLKMSWIGNYSRSSEISDRISLASGNIFSSQFSANYQVNNSSVISFNAGILSNQVDNSNRSSSSFREYRNTINYLYKFNQKK